VEHVINIQTHKNIEFKVTFKQSYSQQYVSFVHVKNSSTE